MACRTGCRTKDHGTWGECARAASLQVNALVESAEKDDFRQTNADLSAYAAARAQGIQPESTRLESVRKAQAASSAMGVPYDANTMPPAKMIASKQAAKYVASTAGA